LEARPTTLLSSLARKATDLRLPLTPHTWAAATPTPTPLRLGLRALPELVATVVIGLDARHDGRHDAIVVHKITIDGAGRLVVPKAIRDRWGLRAGTVLRLREEGGRLVLSTEREEPALVEQGGFLAVELGAEVRDALDHRPARDSRIDALVDYALQR
jgi:AbrB family looped-hinge helix DNA binding protein